MLWKIKHKDILLIENKINKKKEKEFYKNFFKNLHRMKKDLNKMSLKKVNNASW